MKKNLLNQKNKYLSIIYSDVLQHKSLHQIHQDLLNATINPNKPLLAYVTKIANRAKKLDKGAGQYYGPGGLDVLAIAILHLYLTEAYNHKASKLIHSEIRKYESEQKADILTDLWKENRQNGKIFYVASMHRDSAPDHEPWQGKVYVDRYWHNYDTNGQIQSYIQKHNIRTVQWVVGKPVWFVTRPNCRHYFTTYSIDEILNGRYKVPKRAIGDRRLQTPADANLEYYQDRLRLLETMYKRHKTELLRNQINKNRLLVTKWKKMV